MKLRSEETNIFFTSDTHGFHKNIVSGVSDWKDKNGCRDFKSIEAMNETIINGINNTVGIDDTLFHLGDWSFGGIDNIVKFRHRLNVKKIHLILGNHDHHISKNREVELSKELTPLKSFFTSVQDYLDLTIDKKAIVLSHYPMISWNKSYRNSWMLHGHCHDTLDSPAYRQWGGSDYFYTSSKILDVGMDTAFRLFGEYRPFSYKEIKTIMDKKDFNSIDHHTKNTNR